MSETAVIVGVRTLGRAIARYLGGKGWRVVCPARTAAGGGGPAGGRPSGGRGPTPPWPPARVRGRPGRWRAAPPAPDPPEGESAGPWESRPRRDRQAWTHGLVLRPPAGDWTAPT